MSLENLKLGMGLGKSLYQKVPTKYAPLDGIDIKSTTLPLVLLLMVGLFLIWGKDV